MANKKSVEINGKTYYADLENNKLYEDEAGNESVSFLFPSDNKKTDDEN